MKKYVIGLVLSGTLVLSGCNFGTSIEDQLSEVLTEMNNAEKIYRESQVELTSLEVSEQQLFSEMMELTQEQKAELKTKVEELEQLLGQRLTSIGEEEASMKKSIESIDSFDAIIEKAEGNDKTLIEQLKKAIDERYDLHSTFVEEYKKLTDLQKELYEMLVAEGTDLPELKDKVSNVNEQNESVQLAVNSFNEATVKVNELKEEAFKGFNEKK